MKHFAWLIALAFTINSARAEILPLDTAIEKLQHEWATANYQTPEKDQEEVFKKLSEQAKQVTMENPGKAEPLIWEAIIVSGYAKAKGGLGALSLAKRSRDLLLEAEKINPQALNGSIYTSLGSLYYKVPGWPLGFGDHKQARAYLGKALAINPDGIDPNYFYGDFLLKEGEYVQALAYFKKALNAPARPGREDADAGRKADIQQGIKQAEKKL